MDNTSFQRRSWIGISVSLVFALALTTASPDVSGAAPATSVAPGIDTWIERGLSPLAGKRVGLVTNTTGRTADGRLTAEVLASRSDIELVALFTPEHAFAAREEGPVEGGTHATTGLPIHSLYGDSRRPTPEMLRGLEGLVFDIQDVGTRFYTYATTLAYVMEETARADLPVVVLDRPNPIGGTAVSGPVLDAELRSFIGYGEIPIRHGMTMGELALLFNDEYEIGADLTVVPARGWRRDMWYDETGLLWVDPSPNMRNLTQALLYPAVGSLEWTNVSVGRGTDAPFEWLGAPWIDPLELSGALRDADLPGVTFVPRYLTPTSAVHAGLECGGVNLLVTARKDFDAARTAVVLAVTLQRLYPDVWDTSRLLEHWGDPQIRTKLIAGWSVQEILDSWEPRLRAFREIRSHHLLYESPLSGRRDR